MKHEIGYTPDSHLHYGISLPYYPRFLLGGGRLFRILAVSEISSCPGTPGEARGPDERALVCSDRLGTLCLPRKVWPGAF